ncbi:helix-turn-helix domain-containing protein [Cytobacillus kochii]|uniref:helix-turn-helix domain-containing protein n=1 Tax=Cytobacillus kochii TaxID=859143 RepID=UPI001CD1C884|nr:helix-turn-helix transcriptional regulator [Cytobacillus kochii]MCA1027053.1 helix-turn-helix domain-containing protein [Cytobacillus kochii]
MDELDKQIGSQLRRLRESKQLTLREAGDKIGISHTYVSKVEKGQIPSLQTLHRICEFYDIKLSSLFSSETEDHMLANKWTSFNDELSKRNVTPEEVIQLLDGLKIIKRL